VTDSNDKGSFLSGDNAAYLDSLYRQYEEGPHHVSQEWANAFQGLGFQEKSLPRSEDSSKSKGQEPNNLQGIQDSFNALRLIRAFRRRGHLHAFLDPLGLCKADDPNELDPSHYGFGPEDWDRPIFIDQALGKTYATVREIIDFLKKAYCGPIGVEFMHISNHHERTWIQDKIEKRAREAVLSDEERRDILEYLIRAEGLERFLDTKFVGTKRFGLEGAEAMIPALEFLIQKAGMLGVREIVLGMAHRGRLNVLTNILGKPHRALFHEFHGGVISPEDVEGSGDVKYHLGASADRSIGAQGIHLSLTANPSHLEIVDPVVMGKVRAKQDQHGDTSERSHVVPLLIHGDAAFAGQGVVAECFGLSGLKGHTVGGSLHFIINNQIGFTTNPECSYASPYPSDVAKLSGSPIFHVNGDDPEAVVFVTQIAMEYRQTFHKPVVIDLFCYRRFGHNEADEPAFTQPLMYKLIRNHKTTLEMYADTLCTRGTVNHDWVEERKKVWREKLDVELEAARDYKPGKTDWFDGRWAGLTAPKEARDGEILTTLSTGVAENLLHSLGESLTKIPDGFAMHRTLQRVLEQRKMTFQEGKGINWSGAEALAFGSLLIEGHGVRLSGQDCERGTFSQRHAVLIDQNTEARFTPLNHLAKNQKTFEVINSMLSEEAVLGFEYGYTLAEPQTLVLWEAQFGDFANGAQVVVDQFLSAGEKKWNRMSGLVMLLPHGYEGQGPEHSSARLERYLQACAEDNMCVANCTTPANYFHILRRQMKRDFRKPLILMTPKSLLRHPRCVSALSEMGEGTHFMRVLRDDAERRDESSKTSKRIALKSPEGIRRVVLCSGKIYYDLYEEREKKGINDVYLLRLEQFYPFPAKMLLEEVSRFPNAELVWCQEEPKNMGAWTFVEPYLLWISGHLRSDNMPIRYIGRLPSASTATGFISHHIAQQAAILSDALVV
jgi:2-oxoglutarate dehydrogenase E1 component